MEEYTNMYGETYEDFVRDALGNNEIPWSKDRWVSYWKEREDYEQEQIDLLFMTDDERYGEED